jgi:phage terminase large subunit-like protein
VALALKDSRSVRDDEWIRAEFPKLRALPRWATPRNYNRRTLGGELAEYGRRLGTPFMDWQRLVADVAMELDDDGRLHYRKIVVTIHRQAGKTTLILPWEIHRCLSWAQRQRVVYVAQTRAASRDKLVDEQIPMIQDSPFGQLGKPRQNNGHEAFLFNNRSQIGLMATTKKSGHGFTNDLVVVDEAFAQVDWRVEQSLSPTMIRRPETQWLTISTAGDETSVYLLEQVRRGRHLVEAGADQRVAYFEWSIPIDADMDDREVWFDHMPGLGAGISLEDLIAERATMKDFEFRRAYGNQWTEGLHSLDAVIGPAHWEACSDPDSKLAKKGVLRMAIDVAPDQSFASIGVAGKRNDGIEHIEAIETRPGTAWVVERAKRIAAKDARFENIVALDVSTPAAALIPALERESNTEDALEILPISGRDWNAACASFYDAAVEHTFRHINDSELNGALASAAQSYSADGWHWKRRGDKPITPLCAVTLAHWAFTSADDEYDALSSFF